MNAVIRAVTRTALDYGWEVMGIRDGYAGLVEAKELIPLSARSVDGIIQRGGTILGSLDSNSCLTDAERQKAQTYLAEHSIHALIVIGDGEAQSRAYALSQMGFLVNGVPCSIENEVAGIDMSIGVDTALNIALQTLDQLKITSPDCCYAFLVEVAGQRCGYLALMAGIAGGAEAVVLPEIETLPEQVVEAIRLAHERGKSHAIIVVAEGATYNADRLAQHFAKGHPLGFELQAITLSQIQRGGEPSAYDRLLGTRLGAYAVDTLAHGNDGLLVGSCDGKLQTTPLAELTGKTKNLDPELSRLLNVMTL
jgi:6-phosphofructokinase 1